MEDDSFIVTSSYDENNSQLMNAQNQQNAQTAKVSPKGVFNEVPQAEIELPGPSGTTYTRGARNTCHGIRANGTIKTLRYNKHRYHRTKWTSQNGTPYPKYFPMGLESGKYQKRRGSGQKLHGAWVPSVKLTNLTEQNYHRDVKLAPAPATDHLINSERSDTEPVSTMGSADGDVDTVEPATEIENGSKRKTRLIEKRPQLVIISDGDSDDDGIPVGTSRGTYHIHKKRSSAAKGRAIADNAAVVDSEPEIAPQHRPKPVIFRPRIRPNRDTIEIIFGLGFY